jgi:hypothetical protein
MKHSDGVAPHVGAARAAGPAQILVARGREHVAADLLHIDRELADRPAGIEQIEEAVACRDMADFGRRVDEPALRRRVRHRDLLGARTDRAFESGFRSSRCTPPKLFVGLARITPTPTRPHRGGGSAGSGPPP